MTDATRSRADAEFLRGLGDQIRRLRQARRITQEDLAREAGVHRNFIGGAERGQTVLNVLHLYAVADALGVPASTLLRGVDQGRRSEADGMRPV